MQSGTAIPFFLIVIVMGALGYAAYRMNHDFQDACYAKGGYVASGRDIQLCIKDGLVLFAR